MDQKHPAPPSANTEQQLLRSSSKSSSPASVQPKAVHALLLVMVRVSLRKMNCCCPFLLHLLSLLMLGPHPQLTGWRISRVQQQALPLPASAGAQTLPGRVGRGVKPAVVQGVTATGAAAAATPMVTLWT
jgi:hypothetical protein